VQQRQGGGIRRHGVGIRRGIWPERLWREGLGRAWGRGSSNT